MRSAMAPPSRAIDTSGTTSTAPSSPTRSADLRQEVELERERDERRLGAEIGDEAAADDQPQVTAIAKGREIRAQAREAQLA